VTVDVSVEDAEAVDEADFVATDVFVVDAFVLGATLTVQLVVINVNIRIKYFIYFPFGKILRI
jgi:hypothetical protein